MTDTFTVYDTFELTPTTSANSSVRAVTKTILQVQNAGPNRAFLKYGVGAQTATTTPATGYTVALDVGMFLRLDTQNSTGFSAICASGVATLYCNLGSVA